MRPISVCALADVCCPRVCIDTICRGLARLASIEASLAYHERRLDTIMETMCELKCKRIRLRAMTNIMQTDKISTAMLMVEQLSPAKSPRIHHAHHSAESGGTASSSRVPQHLSQTGELGNRATQQNSPSQLYANISSVQTTPFAQKPLHVDEAFERKIDQPINALAEAAGRLLYEDGHSPAAMLQGGSGPLLHNSPAQSGPLKRRRDAADIGGPANRMYDDASVCDVVSSRILTDQEARGNFLL